jgi:hypothetical protein
MYLKDYSPYLDSSLPRSESQNTIGVNLLGNLLYSSVVQLIVQSFYLHT